MDMKMLQKAKDALTVAMSAIDQCLSSYGAGTDGTDTGAAGDTTDDGDPSASQQTDPSTMAAKMMGAKFGKYKMG